MLIFAVFGQKNNPATKPPRYRTETTRTHVTDQNDIDTISEALVRFGGGDRLARAPRLGDGSPVDKLAFVVNLTIEELAARLDEADRQMAALSAGRVVLEARQRALVTANERLFEAQERLKHLGKLATLGELSATLGHELNQPLSVVLTDADILASREDGPLTDHQEESVLAILAAARRMKEVVSNLARFSRKDPLAVRAVPALDPLEAALVLYRHRLEGRSVRHSVKAPSDPPDLLADPSLVQQVFMNLLANACDAVWSEPVASRWVRVQLEVDDQELRYLFRNGGPPIPREDRGRVFEAFFTTKDPEMGTGLGLALSRDVLRRQNGHLELADDPVTCFVVRLPRAQPGR